MVATVNSREEGALERLIGAVPFRVREGGVPSRTSFEGQGLRKVEEGRV